MPLDSGLLKWVSTGPAAPSAFDTDFLTHQGADTPPIYWVGGQPITNTWMRFDKTRNPDWYCLHYWETTGESVPQAAVNGAPAWTPKA